MSWLLNLDYTVFRWINGLAGHNGLADAFFKAACNDHLIPYTMTFLLLIMVFRGFTRREDRERLGAAVELTLSIVVVSALVQLVIVFVHRNRPFVDHQVNLLFYRPTDWSFPSNPAAAAFTFFFSILFADRRFSVWFLVPAVLISFARVYCGVCYPGDVLGGIALALVSAWLVHRISWISKPLKQMAWSVESYFRSLSSLRE